MHAIAGAWPRWWGWAPRVVAEALVPFTDPLATLLEPGRPAAPASVARTLAASLAPPRAGDPPPEWLDGGQVDSFRRLLHALRAHGAVLCADPVGSGKTFVALAVARALGVHRPVCLVPAPLVRQWTEVAARLDVDAVVWSHALLSRGRLPPANEPLVVVDESHHFRHPGIRRYRTVAPWLVGRRVLLLSATPVVNRPADLFHQLHLGLRDDALDDDGAPSLRLAFGNRAIPDALGRFVVQRAAVQEAPLVRHRSERLESGGSEMLEGLDRLVLSTRPDIAALVRAVLYRAAASSAAALLASLRRYRHLLLNARDARAAGRPLDRRSLRMFVGPTDAQLLLWPLLPDAGRDGELDLDDIAGVEALIAQASHHRDVADAKSSRLEEILRDPTPTLVFVTARETIPYLRSRLPDRWLAWSTGRQAGIGGHRMARRDVLDWFRPDAAAPTEGPPGRPRTLLTTDVAAEGLNLQRAGRVVHYDLPWTEVRLSQRTGRAVRRGSGWQEVEVIRFLPTPGVEARLHQVSLLEQKAAMPGRHGIGKEGRARWEWRREVADALEGPGEDGVAAVESDVPGVLAGVALERDGGRVASVVFHLGADATWREDPALVEARLREAGTARSIPPPPPDSRRKVVAALLPSVRQLLRAAASARIAGVPPTAGAARLGWRLRELAGRAARNRDATMLAELERALRFCTRGHTAGEGMLIESLLPLDDGAVLAALPGLPDPGALPCPLRPRLTGLLFFGCAADWTTIPNGAAGRRP